MSLMKVKASSFVFSVSQRRNFVTWSSPTYRRRSSASESLNGRRVRLVDEDEMFMMEVELFVHKSSEGSFSSA